VLLRALYSWPIAHTYVKTLPYQWPLAVQVEAIKALPREFNAGQFKQKAIARLTELNQQTYQNMVIDLVETMPGITTYLQLQLEEMARPNTPASARVIAQSCLNLLTAPPPPDLVGRGAQPPAPHIVFMKILMLIRFLQITLPDKNSIYSDFQKWLDFVSAHSQNFLLTHAHTTLALKPVPTQECLDRLFPVNFASKELTKLRTDFIQKFKLLTDYHLHPKRTSFLYGNQVNTRVSPAAFTELLQAISDQIMSTQFQVVLNAQPTHTVQPPR